MDFQEIEVFNISMYTVDLVMLHVASCNLYNATFLSDMIDEW